MFGLVWGGLVVGVVEVGVGVCADWVGLAVTGAGWDTKPINGGEQGS